MPHEKIPVAIDDQGKRIDVYLSELFSKRFSRSQIKKLIENGSIKISEKEISPHYKVKFGDLIDAEWGERDDDETRAEDIPIEIVHEDEDIIIVNKPVGMVVHPAHGNPRHTLVNALLYHVKDLSSLGGQVRPGIVHRLDKNTSGIMVIAKNDQAHAFMGKHFKDHTIERIYNVVVRGVVQHNEGLCEEPVGRAFLNRKKVIIKPSGGKDAMTFFRVIKRFTKATLLEVRPHTGRTHQIRVHMRHLGHPVLGDELYGVTSPWIDRQSVHAIALRFTHPRTKKEVYYETRLPEDIKALLKHLEKESALKV